MEKVARRNDAPLLPERGFTLSPAVDANLRERIRTLLVSRNQRNPPKTPCPSPEYNHAPRGSDENQSGQSPIDTKAYKYTLAQTTARLARLEYKESDMGATRFDGPAGQIEADHVDSHSRRPSQPSMQTDRRLSSEWPWSPLMPGLNQRALGDVLGREASIPDSAYRRRSSSSKKSIATVTRIPRFHLRTVPPATDVNKIPRPDPLHVPGSYRSEIDVAKDHGTSVNRAIQEATPEDVDGRILATPFHSGPSNEHSHKAAIEALKDVAKHEHIQVDPAAPSLRSISSRENLLSTTTIKQPQHLLWRPFADHASLSEVAQPILTSAGNHGHLHDEDADIPAFVVGDDQSEEAEDPATPLLQFESAAEARKDQEALPLEGPQISDLLAGLPPLRQGTVERIATHNSTTTASADSERNTPGKHSSSVSSLRSVPLEDQEDTASPVSPLLPEPAEDAEEAENRDEISAPLILDTRRSSQATGKPSPVSRAMSIISEISGRSREKTSSLRSFATPKITDSTSNLTSRPNRRSKRTVQDVETFRASTMPGRKGYQHLISNDQQRHQEGSNSTEGVLAMAQPTNQGEGFTKVITDLESLLKEALTIAGQTASRDHSEIAPLYSQAQGGGYTRVGSDGSANCSECASSLSGTDEEDNHTTLPNHKASHRQKHILINEPAEDALYHGHFKEAHEGTPYPAQSRHASTIPNIDNDQPKWKHDGSHRGFLSLPRTFPEGSNTGTEPVRHQSSNRTDRALIRLPSQSSKLRLELKQPPPTPQVPPSVRAPAKEQHTFLVRDHGGSEDTITRNRIHEYVNAHQRPPVQPRLSSMRLRGRSTRGRIPKQEELNLPDEKDTDDEESDCQCVPYVADFHTSGLNYHPVFQEAGEPSQVPRQGGPPFHPRQDTISSLRNDESQKQETSRQDEAPPVTNTYTLEGRHHFSIREPRGFSLSRSHRRSPIARDWSTTRKRYTATVVCITTAFLGLIIGIYAGEVPAIQYAIADEHHYAILGNVFFFIGLAITTALFYPLPLLHGRKPYTLAALAILLPLQFPQALAINSNRSPYVATYRVGLLVPRVFAGIVMGFANINFKTTLLDLFGASLQSGNPHQEMVNENDVRRHGGGMGVWLGIWTWCAIGSIGVGFLIGAGIISGLDVSWGFWILIILNAAVLVLNILTPEVRRSAYRRSMAEVRNGGDVSRRIARGEIKMHLESTGPIWWWEEVVAGHVLAIRMLLQPGFAVLALYIGWIYGQVVLVIVLLGALLSKYYRFHPQYVGLSVAIIPFGALLAIPFQKASLFSRSRHHPQRTDSMTFQKRVTWTSHLVRRAIFMIALPFADLAYTLSSGGRPTNYMVPIMFAGLIGFLSNLAIAECNGIIMETYDTSDLQPGMTGRPRRVLPEDVRRKRTNFSCFPRVTAGFAIAQTFAFGIAAAVTAWGGVVERHLGAQTATAVMAGVLLVLTLLLIAALWRFKTVQIIPSERFGTNILSGPEDEWKPVIIGNPSGITRRMSILELGTLSRWSEIRRRNKLAPEQR